MKDNKMKPRRTLRHFKTSLQEKVVDFGDKSTLSQAKQTSRVSYSTQVKPFAGKVFYLDLPSNRKAETLENDIKELGGTVEKFFSKEIKYLVSNKREARYVQCLRHDSPVPSPDSGPSSPNPRPNPHRPGSPRGNLKGRSYSQTDTFATSRGKSLVERVVKEQERIQMNKILSNALEWGVKILYVDDVIAFVEKKKKNVINQCNVTTAVKTSAKAESTGRQGFQKGKGARISKPFVKVEDSSRHYRPIYLTMPNMPEFNLKTVPPCSPFCVEDHPGKRQRGHRLLGNRGARASVSEEEGQGRPRKNRDKKRGGYCECCMLKYDNLTVHLQSECHKAFSRSDEYLVVDRLVSTLHCNFIHIKTKANRPKCSISSILITRGPYGKTEQRHEVDVDTTETKEGQHTLWAVPGRGELSGRHSLKYSSVPGSAPIIHSESDKNCGNGSDRSQPKHKSLSCKRPCRQDSLNAQMPRSEAETAPSRGEPLTSNPAIFSRVTQAHLEHHRTTDKNGWAAHTHKKDLQVGVPSNSIIGTSSQHEVSLQIQDSSFMESVQDRHVLPEEMTGLSECDGGTVPTQSHSPVRAVQRRVKVYKRKRRKVDTKLTSQEHSKTNDIPGNSILSLWQLFQSSEDMDLEFRGFED